MGSKEHAEEVMRDVDVNQDGSITYGEFRQMMEMDNAEDVDAHPAMARCVSGGNGGSSGGGNTSGNSSKDENADTNAGRDGVHKEVDSASSNQRRMVIAAAIVVIAAVIVSSWSSRQRANAPF